MQNNCIRLNHSCILLFVLILLLLPGVSVIKAQSPLAPALNFNVFVRNGASIKGIETQGPIAVGGDFTITGDHTVASQNAGTFKIGNTTIGLLIGGRVIYQSGNLFNVNSNAYVKIDDCTGSKIWYKDNNGANANLQITSGQYNASPRINLQSSSQSLGVSESVNPVCEGNLIDFNAAFAQLESNSRSLSTCPNSVVLTDSKGKILTDYEKLPNQVVTTLNTGVNILNISGNALHDIQQFKMINHADATHILVINIDGPGNFTFEGIKTNDFSPGEGAYILYNFYNATKLIIDSKDPTTGCILAPFADVIMGNGKDHIGQIIGQSFEMTAGSVQYFLFNANLRGCGGLCTTPVVSPITGADDVCKGKNTQFTSSTAGGAWSSSNTAIATVDNSGLITAINTGTATISYAVTNDCGTTNVTKDIRVKDLPDKPVITAQSTTEFCPGGSVVLTSTPAVGYEWYKDGKKINDGASQSYTVTLPGRYSVNAINAEGCFSQVASNSVTIGYLPQPAKPVISSAGPIDVCNGESVLLTSSAPSGNQWYKDGVLLTDENNTFFSASSAGVYSVTTDGNNNGCISLPSNGITISITPSPSLSPITGGNSVCTGNTLALSNNTGGGKWVSNDEWIAIVDETTGLVKGMHEGEVLISYSITNASGCTGTVTQTVTVNTSPTVGAIAGSGNLIPGGSSQLINSTPGGVWSSSNTTVATVNNSGLVSGITIGNATITYLISNESGCTASSQLTIKVNPIPSITPNSTPQATLCQYTSLTITNNTPGGIWNSSDESVATISSNGVVDCVAPGATIISYTITDNNGISASRSTTLTVIGLPSAPVINTDAATDTICPGNSILLTSSNASGYKWYRNGVYIPTGNGLQNYIATQAGDYYVTATSAEGCESTPSVDYEVVVAAAAVTPSITAVSATTFCSGSSVVLRSSVSSGNQWYKDGQIINGATNQTYSATGTGVYTAKSTSGQCSSGISNSISVTVNALPAVPTVSAGGPIKFCQGGSVLLTASVSGTVTGYQWLKDNTVIPGATSSTYSATVSGSYKVRVTNSSGCSSTSVAGILVTANALPATPTVSAGGATTFCDGSNVVLTSSSATGDNWYKDGVLITTNNGNTTYTATTSGTYTVRVTNASGCVSISAGVVVTVNSLPVKPVISTNDATTFCSPGSALLSSSSATGNQWYKDGIAIGGETNQNYNASGSGSYTVIVTNAVCSSVASDAMVITVNTGAQTPTITNNTSTTFCAGGSVTLISSSTSNNQWFESGNPISGATNRSYTATTAGSYTVQSTNVSGCVSGSSAAKTVTVNAVPVVAAITGTTSVCVNANTTLANATAGGVWSSSNNGVATINATTGAVTGVSNGTDIISYTVTNGSGCTTTVTTTVTVNALPAVNGVFGEDAVCTTKTISLSSATTGGIWSSSDNNIATINASTGVVTGVAAGSATMIYTITNGNGCTNIDTELVTVNATPIIAAITGASAVCATKKITLSNITAGGVWSSDNTSIAVVSSNGVVTGIAAGTANIIYTVSNISGCSNQVSRTITVNALPVVTAITGVNSVCVGGTTQMANSTTGGVWSSSNIGVATINTTGLITGVSPGSLTINYTVTNGNGCQTTVSGFDVVNGRPSQPVISANGATTFCENGSVTLSSTPEFSYQWLKAGIPVTNTNTQNYHAASSGDYTVQVTNQFGCSSPASIPTTVTVNAIPATPVVSAAGATTFCAGGSVTLNSTATTGNQWYLDGIAIAGATGTSYLANSNDNYHVVATSINGCSSAASNSILTIITPLPVTPSISAGSTTSFCQGGSVLLTSSAVSGDQWYKDGNAISGATGKTYTANSAGVYTVRKTANNCVSAVSNSITVTVFALPPTPSITPSSPTSVCAGNTVTLTSSAATGNQWYRNNAAIQNNTGPGFVAVITGNYSVRVTNSNGCISTSAATSITVNAKPVVAAITGDNSICINTSSQLTSATPGGVWSSSNTSVVTINSTGLVTGVGNGNAIIRYTVTNSSGCSTAVTTIITVNTTPSIPAITAQSATTFCDGGSVLLVSSSSSGNQWSLDGELIDSANDQQLLASVPGLYTVMVTNTSGCISNGSSAGISVNINSIPDQPIISANGSTDFCSGGSVVLSSSAGSGNQWYIGNGLIAGATGTTYTASVPGTYTVISTNGSGCSSEESNSTTVIVIPLPAQPVISAESATTFCSGDSVVLRSSSTSGNQWYKDGQVIPGAVDPSYTASQSGTYYVVVTSIAGCNSSASNSITVTVNSRPNVGGIIGNQSVCVGASTTLSNNTPGGVWSSSNLAFAAVSHSLGIVNGIRSGTVTIAYTVVNANGCASAATLEMKINNLPDKPKVSAGGPDNFCQGGSVLLTSTKGNNYQWYRNNNIIIGANSKDYTATTSGNYTVTVTGISGCSSQPSTPVTITVNPIPAAPVITADKPTTICTNTILTLSSNASSGNQWYRNGILLKGIVNQSYKTSAPGVYSVTTTSIRGCASTASTGVTVAVNPLPVVARITGSKSICTGSTATLANATAGGVWSSGDNAIATINGSTGVLTGVNAGPVTIYYSVTDGNGCTGTSSTTDIIRATPERPEISNETPTAFCAGGSVELISSSATGNQWFKDGNIITGANSQEYIANSQGIYTVSVTGSSGCVANGISDGDEVIVFALPVVAPIAGSNSVCVNSTAKLTTNTPGGIWSSNNADIATVDSTGLVTGLSAGNVSISYTVTNSNACAVVVTSAITINSIPTAPTISAGGATIFCTGSSVVLTSSTASSYQWYKDGNIIPGATAQTYTATTTGNYSVVTFNTNGCTGKRSNQLTVTVNPLPPTPLITAGGSTSFCFGKNVVLNSDAGSNDQWYKDSNPVINATEQNYTASASGSYAVTSTSEAGCESLLSTAIVITVNSLPLKPTITPNSIVTLCQGDSAILTSSAATGNQWYRNGNIITGATKNTFLGSTSGKFTVIITGSNGCTISSDTVTGNLLSRPSLLSIDGRKIICEADSAQWNNATTGGVWSSSNTGIATVGTRGLVKGVTAGSTTITYSVTYPNGCSTRISSVVTINAKPAVPVITASGATSFCNGRNVTLTSNVNTGNKWYKNNLSIAGVTSSGYIASSSGNYRITTSNAITGCTSSLSTPLTVTVNGSPALPVLTATGPAKFCAGDSVLLSSSAPNNQWYRNDTLITGATASTYRAKTSANYTAVAISSNGCSSPASKRLPVTAVSLPAGKILGTPTRFLCTDSTIILQAAGGNRYRWYNNNVLITGATDDSLAVKTTGNYRAVLIGEFGCEVPADQTVAVSIIKKPVANFAYDAYCVNKIINLQSTSDVSASGAIHYFWTDGSILSKSYSSAPSYTPTLAGAFKVKLVVTPLSCPAAADSIIKDLVIETPVPSIRMAPVDVMINDPVQLQARNFGTSYLWTPATFLSSATISNPVVRATAEQQYIIRIRVPSTCETNDTLLVRIHNENTVTLPSLFTPNGDGLNDKLYINYVGIRELKIFSIYNRIGRKVFETRNLADGWDGNYGYEKMPTDSYTWMIEAIDKNGNLIRKQGTVTLLR